MQRYILVAFAVVLLSSCCSCRMGWHHRPSEDIFDRENYYYNTHKNRVARSRFHVRDTEGGAEGSPLGPPLEAGEMLPEVDNAVGSEAVLIYTPAFDRYNLNEMEIALAQTLYLMIAPDIRKAVEFKMNEIVTHYKNAGASAPPPGYKPPNAIAPPTKINPQQAINQPASGGHPPRPAQPQQTVPSQNSRIVPAWDYTRPSNNVHQPPQQGQAPQSRPRQQNPSPGAQQRAYAGPQPQMPGRPGQPNAPMQG